MIRSAITFAIFFLSTQAMAVIGGQPSSAKDVATVELEIGHRLFSGARGYVTLYGTCSAVVVGVEPLTLLTASHCFRDLAKNDQGQPLVRLQGRPELRVAHVIANDIKKVQENRSHDIAAVIFAHDEERGAWREVRLSQEQKVEQLLVCGYGYSQKEGASREPRCAVREVENDPMNFDRFMPAAYRTLDQGLYDTFHVQFNSKEKDLVSLDRIVALTRLEAGNYSFGRAMPREGDSGGPWYVMDQHGNLKLYALYSFGETFRRKNAKWPVFADPQVPTDDLPYAAYGVRLNTPEAEAIFSRAISEGGDLSLFLK